MSRSKRHIPICGVTTAKSEKKDKRIYNRILRRKTKELIRKKEIDKLPKSLKEIVDVWSMDKDGKMMFDNLKQEYPYLYNKCMRK